VSVARDVADALELERVLWIPAGEPPHKDAQPRSAASSRLAMARAAVTVDDRFEVSDVEVERQGPSYAIETVRTLGTEFGDAELFLIIGVDQYRTFDSWEAPYEILQHAHLAVVDRDGASARSVLPTVLSGAERLGAKELLRADETPDTKGASRTRVVFVPVERIDLSSTDIRRRANAGEDVSHLVPAPVLEIIDREGLYRI
jgi:nicotinate-nucleotide adenylyltransferase